MAEAIDKTKTKTEEDTGYDYAEDLIISAEDVYKIYKQGEIETVALRGVTLQIYDGELVAIIGPSGSGKTTLLNILGGLDRATAGRVYWSINKHDITKLDIHEITKARRHFIGFVFQTGNLNPYLTAYENIELPARIAGVPRAERKKRVEYLLNAVGLEHRANHFPNALSGGEMQRVAIASALVNNPRLVLADEPTGSLDAVNAEKILDLFRLLNKETGVAFLIVTHSQQVASKAKRTLEISDGIVSGIHDEGISIRDLDRTRILRLDNQGRIHLPDSVLKRIGYPKEFQLEIVDNNILLIPRKEGEKTRKVAVELVTCKVCGALVPKDRTTCPECGTIL